MKSAATGIAVGMAAGAIAYAASSATPRKKRMLKTRTGRALHAVGDMMESLSMFMG